MSPFWKDLLSNGIEILFLIITPIVLMLAKRLLLIIEDKWNITLNAQQEEQIEEYVKQAIAYVNEQTHKLSKNEHVIPSENKRNMAIQYVTEAIKNSRLTDLPAEIIGARIEARLNTTREAPK